MTDEITAYEEEVWLPEYVYVLQQKEAENPAYTPYGFDQLEVPSDCTTVSERMSWLTVRFNERYCYRRLNAETMDRWQIQLQNRFDEVVRLYERAYKLYTDNADTISNIKEGVVQTETQSGTSGDTESATDSSDGTTKNIDTPDEPINTSADYASQYLKQNSTGSRSITRNGTTGNNSTSEMTYTGRKAMENANANIDAYRDLDTQFIKEFESNFLNILWY